jgi:hypothetical protein
MSTALAAAELEVPIGEPVSLPRQLWVLPLRRLLKAGREIPDPRLQPSIQGGVLRPESSLAQRTWPADRSGLASTGRGFDALLEPLPTVTPVPAGMPLPTDAFVAVAVCFTSNGAAARRHVAEALTAVLTLG